MNRVAYIVYVDLDPISGYMHSKESAQHQIRRVLLDRLGPHHPVVSLAPLHLQPLSNIETRDVSE